MFNIFKKGNWFYETQIFMVVIMWQHDKSHKPNDERGFRWGRLFIWRDTAWSPQRQLERWGRKIEKTKKWLRRQPAVEIAANVLTTTVSAVLRFTWRRTAKS